MVSAGENSPNGSARTHPEALARLLDNLYVLGGIVSVHRLALANLRLRREQRILGRMNWRAEVGLRRMLPHRRRRGAITLLRRAVLLRRGAVTLLLRGRSAELLRWSAAVLLLRWLTILLLGRGRLTISSSAVALLRWLLLSVLPLRGGGCAILPLSGRSAILSLGRRGSVLACSGQESRISERQTVQRGMWARQTHWQGEEHRNLAVEEEAHRTGPAAEEVGHLRGSAKASAPFSGAEND